MSNKLIWLLRFILGSLFIVSAVSKLFPIEAFDLTIVNQEITDWSVAPYLSRFIISIELFLGFSFFISVFVKKIAIPFSFLLLFVFCIQLIFIIASGSGSKNCGCFGEFIPMSSLEALIKNIILIFLLFLIKKYFTYDKKLNFSLPFGIFSIVFAGIFLIFQIKPYKIPQKNEESSLTLDSAITTSHSEIVNERDTTQNKKETLAVTKDDKTKTKSVSVFAPFKDFGSNQTVNLDEGIKLVCLFSLDCEDCMETAHKLGQAKKDWKNFPPIYVLFLGKDEQIKGFFEAAETTFPYKIISAQTFFPLINNHPPRVVLMNYGNVIGDWNYESFDLDKLNAKLESL